MRTSQFDGPLPLASKRAILKVSEIVSQFTFKSKLGGLALVLGTLVISANAQSAQNLPKELVEYVVAARASGQTDAKIRQEAITAGWPTSMIDQALGVTTGGVPAQPPKSEEAPKTAAPAQAAAPTQAAPPTSSAQSPSVTVPAAQPAAQAPSAPPPAQPPTAAPRVAAPPPDASEPKDRGVPNDYRIGAGDVLSISAWKEPDASVPSEVVRPDGKITLPLIKDVEVTGFTPAEIEKTIAQKLEKFIQGVDVTVIVISIQSKKIYVIGAVKKEGPIGYTQPMSIMQALTEAGGLNDYAKRKKIYILRNEGGKEYRLPFDYDAVLKGEKLEQNIELMSGDQIVVPH